MNEKSSFDLEEFACLLEAKSLLEEAQINAAEILPCRSASKIGFGRMSAQEAERAYLSGELSQQKLEDLEAQRRVRENEVMAQLALASQLLARCQGFVPKTTRLYRDIYLFMEPKYISKTVAHSVIPSPDELDASAKRMKVSQDGEDRRQSEANAERALALQGKPNRAQELSMIAERRALRKFLSGSEDGVL